MKPPICVDVDNVIARTDEIMREIIRLFSKNKVDLRYEDIVEFDYWKCVDQHGRRFLKTEWQNVHIEFTRNHIHRVRPFNEVQEHLLKLSDRFEIHIATSRLPEGREATHKWLSAHSIPFSRLHFVDHRQKHILAKQFVAAIEDDRSQAELFHERGVQAFLLAHPWNVVPPGSQLKRIEQWPMLVEHVLKIRS